jgi:tetratricopeptide (TPR) repeat protein
VPLGRALVALGVLTSPMWVLFFLRPPAVPLHWPAVLINTTLFAVSMVIAAAWHEAAHASVARLLRYRVPRITLGHGRQVARFRVGETLIQLCLLPLAGFTYFAPETDRVSRLRTWLIVAAGPASNALACSALWPLFSESFALQGLSPFARIDVPYVLFAANFILGVGNLLPMRVGNYGASSDGLQLVRLPFMRADALQGQLAMASALRAYEATEEGGYEEALAILDEASVRLPDAWILRHDRAVALSRLGRFDPARSAFEALLDHPKARGRVRAIIESNIAWCLVMSEGDAEVLDRAEALSASATKAFGGHPAIAGVRGAVLARRGDPKAAIPLLEKALDLNPTAILRAHNAAWLALAHAHAGSHGRAHHYMTLASQLDSDCRSLVTVEPLVARLRDNAG